MRMYLHDRASQLKLIDLRARSCLKDTKLGASATLAGRVPTTDGTRKEPRLKIFAGNRDLKKFQGVLRTGSGYRTGCTYMSVIYYT